MQQSSTDAKKDSLDNVKNQISTVGSQIQNYLKNVNATIENYKFNVERTGNGISIDIALKATIQTKSSAS